MGRPPLTDEQLRAKVLSYCERYGVSPVPESGLPPFPSGQRETHQHRDWLTVYRALQRFEARSAATAAATAPSDSDTLCPVCALALKPENAVLVRAGGRRAASWNTHPACADLLRQAGKSGPAAVARLNGLLWPRSGRPGS